MLLKRKKSWPGLYAGGTLFAPTEDMWLLHLAARPGMSRKDVVRAARRPQDQIATSFRRRGYGETINEQAVLVAIARHLASASWVNDWTWKGSEAPAGVTVVTTAQIRYLSQWLNPTGHCRASKISTTYSYGAWIEQGMIPDAHWLRWLYGDSPPEGVYVLPPIMERFRTESHLEGIIAAAKIDRATYFQWKRDENKWRILQALVNSYPSARAAEEVNLRADTRKHLKDYAKAASLEERCQRAGWGAKNDKSGKAKTDRKARTGYFNELKDAEKRCGREAKGALLSWLALDGRGPYGLYKDHLFVPSEGMRRFRQQALKGRERPATGMDLLMRHPGFMELFADWTGLPSYRGKRRKVDAVVRKNSVVGKDQATPGLAKLRIRQAGVGSKGGRPSTNDDVVAFAAEQRSQRPDIRAKEILKLFRQQRPEHLIFKSRNPTSALRAAILQRRDKRAGN